MLDEYIDSQKIVYKTLKNAVNKETYSHAYLFESNGNPDAFDIALSFSKLLLCPNKYSNNEKCNGCTQCNRINNNNFSEIKVIDPDGMWIKKEQLDDLQKSFSVKSVETSKKIYIIKNAEKLNVQSSNSILKFLEEPEDNIIAILITDNIYQLLDTIISRCQIIKLAKKTTEYQYINNSEEYIELKNNINDFVTYLEKNKYDTLLNTQKIWHEKFKDRIENINAFELLIIYYKDVLNKKLNRNLEVFKDFESEIENISKINTFDEIIFKINKILELKDHLKVNANQSLLLDKLVLEIVGGEKDE